MRSNCQHLASDLCNIYIRKCWFQKGKECLKYSWRKSSDRKGCSFFLSAMDVCVVLFSPKGEMEVQQWLDLFQIVCTNLKAPISCLTELFLTYLAVKDVALVTWANLNHVSSSGKTQEVPFWSILTPKMPWESITRNFCQYELISESQWMSLLKNFLLQQGALNVIWIQLKWLTNSFLAFRTSWRNLPWCILNHAIHLRTEQAEWPTLKCSGYV